MSVEDNQDKRMSFYGFSEGTILFVKVPYKRSSTIPDTLRSWGGEVVICEPTAGAIHQLARKGTRPVVVLPTSIDGSQDGISLARRIVDIDDIPIVFVVGDRGTHDELTGLRSFIHCGVLYSNAPGTVAVETIRLARELHLERRSSGKHSVVDTIAHEDLALMTAGVAHDLNNLLSVILEYQLIAIEQAKGSGDATFFLDGSRAAAERAVRLTRRLVRLGRSGPGDRVFIDLAESIRGLLGIVAPLVGRRIAVSEKIDEEPLAVFCDPAKIDQIVLNLLLNARSALPDGGSIEVSLRRLSRPGEQAEWSKVEGGPYVELKVSDNGIGIAPEKMDSIFSDLYTSKNDKATHGIGLSVVKSVAQELHGHISVASTPGSGTEFRVLIPVDRRAPEPSRAHNQAFR